jgi:CBS domain-containing protein
MLVRDLMTPDSVTVNPETRVKQALVQLARLGITSMPVVDGKQRLCGIVSEADLICDLVTRDPRAQERPVMVESLFVTHRPRSRPGPDPLSRQRVGAGVGCRRWRAASATTRPHVTACLISPCTSGPLVPSTRNAVGREMTS